MRCSCRTFSWEVKANRASSARGGCSSVILLAFTLGSGRITGDCPGGVRDAPHQSGSPHDLEALTRSSVTQERTGHGEPANGYKPNDVTFSRRVFWPPRGWVRHVERGVG